MANFLSIFCPELQKLLKPIYDLKRKGRQFTLGEEQQVVLEEIKCRLIKPAVLNLSDSKGTFQQSQAKSSGINLPGIHGINKGLDPNIQAEKQVLKPIGITKAKEISQNKTKVRIRKSRIKM